MTTLKAAVLAAGLAIASTTVARADGLPGTSLPIMATGSSITVQYLGSNALYYNELWLATCSGTTCTPTSKIADKTAGLQAPVTIPGFAPGSEVVFALYVQEPGQNMGTWYFTGDPARNPDGLAHIQYWGTSGVDGLPGLAGYNAYGWEDICGPEGATSGSTGSCTNGGSDRDFNDAVFALQGATVTPEPVSMTLLATGLAGMGGAGLMKRRRRKLDA